MSADFPWLREAAKQLDRAPRGQLIKLPMPLRLLQPDRSDVLHAQLALSARGPANDPEPPKAA